MTTKATISVNNYHSRVFAPAGQHDDPEGRKENAFEVDPPNEVHEKEQREVQQGAGGGGGAVDVRERGDGGDEGGGEQAHPGAELRPLRGADRRPAVVPRDEPRNRKTEREGGEGEDGGEGERGDGGERRGDGEEVQHAHRDDQQQVQEQEPEVGEPGRAAEEEGDVLEAEGRLVYELKEGMASYYEILGCEKGASYEELKRRYHELARRCHPDKREGSRAEFEAVEEAWRTLRDAERRREYDLRIGKAQLEEMPVYCEVGLSEMSREGGRGAYSYECRCGGVYTVAEKDVSGAEKVKVPCDECTFHIIVLSHE